MSSAHVLSAGDARLRLDPHDGCRITSLELAGREVLVTTAAHPFYWGWYLLAPWAGRIRGGVASFAGDERCYPTGEDGHALHGLVHDRSFRQVSDDTFEVTVEDWFAPLVVQHRVALLADRLELTLRAIATERAVPVTLGWHPWFRRYLDGVEVEVVLPAAWMLERDPDGITSSRRVDVPAQPWDDVFGGIDGEVLVRWADTLTIAMTSDAPVAVVFTELETGVCVEPQSGPPNEVNAAPRVVEPGAPLELHSSWRWSLEGDPTVG